MKTMKTNKEKSIFYFEKDPGFETLIKITNGYFTMLKMVDGRTAVMNESGELSLSINKEATEMFGVDIYGNIAIIGKFIQ